MLIRLLFILRRRWPVALLVPLLAAAAGYAFTPRGDAVVPTAFVATAVVAAEQGTSPIEVQQTMLDAEQGSIAVAVARDVGGGLGASEVGERLSATFDEEAFVVTLAVSGDTAADAERLARSFSDAFVEEGNLGVTDEQETDLVDATRRRDEAREALNAFLEANSLALAAPVPEPRLLSDRDVLQGDVDDATARLATLEQSQQQQPTDTYRLINVTSAERSVVDKLQIPASVTLRVTLGFLFGIVGAIVLIAIIEKLNPRIDSPEHATELVGAPVLAMVPVMGWRRGRRQAISRASPAAFRGPFAESFRSMRTHLEFRAAADRRNTPARIMITSATPSEGKSTTAAFLAVAFGEVGKPPVVVGGDLRRPSVHTFFDVPRIPGLSSRAAGGGTVIPLDEIVKLDPETGVSVVPAGPQVDRVTGLLGDLAAVTLAAQSSGRNVILDTAPVMVANDAVDFLTAVDWVIVVIRVGRSTERSVKQMMQSLQLNEANVVGVVMVGSLESSDAKRYYYSYYSDDPGGGETDYPRPVIAPADDGRPTETSGAIGSP